jgi:hypothetical protein
MPVLQARPWLLPRGRTIAPPCSRIKARHGLVLGSLVDRKAGLAPPPCRGQLASQRHDDVRARRPIPQRRSISSRRSSFPSVVGSWVLGAASYYKLAAFVGLGELFADLLFWAMMSFGEPRARTELYSSRKPRMHRSRTNPADRTTLSKAIDVVLKQNIRLTFPETSQAINRRRPEPGPIFITRLASVIGNIFSVVSLQTPMPRFGHGSPYVFGQRSAPLSPT